VVLLRWHLDPIVVAALCLLVLLWSYGVRRARAAGGTVDRSRQRWFAAAVAVLVVALWSPLAYESERHFSVHMAQHLLLTYGAAPLLAFAAPVTLALQASSTGGRRRVLLPALRSRTVKAVSHPVVTFALFAGVMYATHFSAIYDVSLRNPVVHGFEHLLYLGAASLFWWPVVRRDPVPGRFPWAARLGYLFLAMPLQSLLGVAILNSERVLYPSYLRYAARGAVLNDQHLAGAFMWVGGDLLMLTAIGCGIAAWVKAEGRHQARVDADLDALYAARSAPSR
jgi:putative copper resistance protein D